MRNSMTRHLMLGVCATAVVSVITATGADAKQIRKHHQRFSQQRMDVGFNDVRAARASMVAPVSRGNVCPGIARSFECSVWPPPFDEDPDRKMSGSDGG